MNVSELILMAAQARFQPQHRYFLLSVLDEYTPELVWPPIFEFYEHALRIALQIEF